jgi:hypothetical protein
LSPALGKSSGRRRASLAHRRSTFERVQSTSAPSPEGVSATAERAPYLNAFKRNSAQPRAGKVQRLHIAAPSFERVQMTLERRTELPITSRPKPLNGPPRRPQAQTLRPRSTSNLKEANPMFSTQ